MPNEILTEREVAALLRVNRATIASLRKAGHGPSWFQVGNSIRYYARDVDRWIERHRKKGETNEKAEIRTAS